MLKNIKNQLRNLRPVRTLSRWQEMQSILLKYGFDFLIDLEEVKELRALLNKSFHLPGSEFVDRSPQERLRLMLQEMGTTYIKLGQILASRGDLLPAAWVDELSKLRDSVPPFSFNTVRDIIEAELEQPLEAVFLEFSQEPIAAASIGQVHHAVLPNLNEVVVKIRRPGVKEKVRSDMEIIHDIVRLINSRTSWGKKYGVLDIYEEINRTLSIELDFRNEATNAIRLRRIMQSEAKVYVPYIFQNLSSEQVLTMEYIKGVQISNLAVIDEAGINRKLLATTFIRSIFKQLLIDGFFHADPHPGNLLVNLEEKSINYIDLGMMGRLMPEQRHQLADMVRSILRRDSMDVMRLVLSIGTPFDDVDEINLRREIDFIINRYLEASLEQISFSSLINEILGVVFSNNIRLPSELSLAFKTIMQGEEVARSLDESISVTDILNTIAQQILFQMIDPSNLLDHINDTIREVLRLRNVIPRALESILKQIESGSLTVAIEIPFFSKIVNSLLIIANRLVAGLMTTGMIIGSALVMNIKPSTGTEKVIQILGIIAFIVSLIFATLLTATVIFDTWQAIKQKKRNRI